MTKCVFIVEGWKDSDQLKKAYPDIETIVTNGTRLNTRIRQCIQEYKDKGYRLYILSDPDEAGDQLARMIRGEYRIPRILVNPEQARVRLVGYTYKYGVEYMSIKAIKEHIGWIMEE